MPITYHTAADGTRYPVYSGSDVLAEVHQFYMAHAASYGYTSRQMQLLLAGHPQPMSMTLKKRVAAVQSGHCCRFDPSALRVGSRVPSMADESQTTSLPPVGQRMPGSPLTHGRLLGDAVTGTIPSTVAAAQGTVLSSGAVVRPSPPPHSALTPILIVMGAITGGVLCYGALKKYLTDDAHSITVAAPKGKE